MTQLQNGALGFCPQMPAPGSRLAQSNLMGMWIVHVLLAVAAVGLMVTVGFLVSAGWEVGKLRDRENRDGKIRDEKFIIALED